jgi:hypothetical protein
MSNNSYENDAQKMLKKLNPRMFVITGDPIDNRYVVLKDSERFPLAGEGLVAKIDIPKDTVFCHMSGHIMTYPQLENHKMNISKYMKENNWQPGFIL